MSRHLLATSGGGTQRPVRSQARRGTRGARPLLRTPAPERVPPAVRRQEPRRQGPIEVAATLYAQGHYNQAASVLNDAIRRSSQRWPDDLRAVYHERNSLADADISECSGALRYDPGNVNARKFLDKAYTTKVDILRSLTG